MLAATKSTMPPMSAPLPLRLGPLAGLSHAAGRAAPSTWGSKIPAKVRASRTSRGCGTRPSVGGASAFAAIPFVGAGLDGGGIDAGGLEQIEQAAAGLIRPGDAHDGDVARELTDVARDVGRAAGVIRFVGDVDHGDGRFGRDALDFAPDEFVEHQVTHHQDAATLRGLLAAFPGP